MRPLLFLLIGVAMAPGAAFAQSPRAQAAEPRPVLAPLPSVDVTAPAPEARTALPPPAPVAAADSAAIPSPSSVNVPPTLAPAKQGVNLGPTVVGVAAGAAGGAVAGPVGKFIGGFLGKRVLGPIFGGNDDIPRLQVVDNGQAHSADAAGKDALAAPATAPPLKETVASSKVAER